MKARIEALTPEAFAPFGEVIQTRGADRYEINDGFATRFHRLSRPDPGPDGTVILSIFRGSLRPPPLRLAMLERHPLGTQSFIPLAARDWLVAVAESPVRDHVRVFRARGDQGVTYAAGVWHHPLLVLTDGQEFLVADRDGPGDNLEEIRLADPVEVDPD